MKNFSFVLLFLLLNFILFFNQTFGFACAQLNRPVLIVISLDGFKKAFLNRGVTPNLNKFRSGAARIKLLKTLKASNAFNTHHTIATGFYAKHHGAVGHTTWSQNYTNGKSNEYTFVYSKLMYEFNPKIVPIWTLNQFNGGRSACMMWPGCEFDYLEDKISYLMNYNSATPIKERFEKIGEWLNSSLSPPNLVMFYIENPDKNAHIYGPDGEKVNTVMKEIDDGHDALIKKLDELNLKKLTNIIYLSDHSVWPVKRKDMIDPYYVMGGLCPGTPHKYFLDPAQMELVPGINGSQACITYSIKHWKFLYTSLSDVEYNRERQRNSAFVLPRGRAFLTYMTKYITARGEGDNETIYGAHGSLYDQDVMFMAGGPAFVTGDVDTVIYMVDFYSLFAHILKIPGHHQNEGSFSRSRQILIVKEKNQINWLVQIIVIIICSGIHCYIFYYAVNIYERKKNHDLGIYSIDEESIEEENTEEENTEAVDDENKPVDNENKPVENENKPVDTAKKPVENATK